MFGQEPRGGHVTAQQSPEYIHGTGTFQDAGCQRGEEIQPCVCARACRCVHVCACMSVCACLQVCVRVSKVCVFVCRWWVRACVQGVQGVRAPNRTRQRTRPNIPCETCPTSSPWSLLTLVLLQQSLSQFFSVDLRGHRFSRCPGSRRREPREGRAASAGGVRVMLGGLGPAGGRGRGLSRKPRVLPGARGALISWRGAFPAGVWT